MFNGSLTQQEKEVFTKPPLALLEAFLVDPTSLHFFFPIQGFIFKDFVF